MQKYMLMGLLMIFAQVFGRSLSKEDADKIADRIWENECAKSVDKLTHWNQGENFASLGIGHFIWYSSKKKEIFDETFPQLLAFLQKKHASFPSWLKVDSTCPWHSREEFYQAFDSGDMKALRKFLFDTKSLQALFIIERLSKDFALILKSCPASDKESLQAVFQRLSEDRRGLFALIDYVNFKGNGTSIQERYNGKGWGLWQVLQRLSPSSKHLLQDFVDAAKFVLQQRIENSPKAKKEARWRLGWYHRLDGYLMEF
jgi:hypothetical protein